MSLAIAERKTQLQQRRPGGFAGVFFHLLDWNRRLARKKLFPRRKLLPPVRAAKASVTAKTFAADDKMPLAKFLLIDDENQGGFPSMKKLDDLGRGMRAPGLVARLMGLESMPVVAHERPRKATDSSCLCNREESDGVFHRIDQNLCVESCGIRKQECRPQKLRKTGGFLERPPVDGGHGKASLSGKKKTVLSSPSKNKLHKPPSPVKSSRSPSGRLMKTATRILEPGLQNRGRAKVAITYKDSLIFGAESGEIVATLKNSNEPFGDSVSESSMTGGRSDGELRLQLGAEENRRPRIGSSAFHISNASCSHTDFAERSFLSLAMHAEQRMDNEIFKPFQSKMGVQNIEEELREKNDQGARKTKLDRSSNILRRNQLRQNHATNVREKVAFGTSVCLNSQGGRDAIKISSRKGSAFAVRNTSNGSRSKLACEQNGYRRSLGTSPTRNMAQKRTTSTFCGDHAEILHSTSTKQNVGINFSDRKGLEQNNYRSVSQRCFNSNSNCKSGSEFDFKSSDIVSFTFNSPVKHTPISPTNEEPKMKIMSRNGYFNNIGCDAKLDSRNNVVSNRIATLRGDESRNLLEEKIEELTFMDHNLLIRAAISFPCLEDLGVAFISEQNEHKQTSACSKKNVMSSPLDSSCFQTSQRQDNVKTVPASVLEMESSQLSPISILEASFSNESCSIGSLNTSSGRKLQVGLVENCNTPQSTDTDTDLLDSATSVHLRRSIVDKIQHLSRITSSADDIRHEVGFSNSEFFEARHFISNAVLLFENFTPYGSNAGSFGISLESTLLDLLQGVCDALLIPSVDPGFRGVKETDRLRELLFDCVIECLDSKYSFSCKSDYMKIPFLLTREKLMEELHKQITDWMDLAGKFLDDLVKNEMKSSTEKWTVCEIEACEAGMELENNILQVLVEEILIDFY